MGRPKANLGLTNKPLSVVPRCFRYFIVLFGGVPMGFGRYSESSLLASIRQIVREELTSLLQEAGLIKTVSPERTRIERGSELLARLREKSRINDAKRAVKKFVCLVCQETFVGTGAMWHCTTCGKHWRPEIKRCKNCRSLRPPERFFKRSKKMPPPTSPK
jgi:hypothetical protein